MVKQKVWIKDHISLAEECHVGDELALKRVSLRYFDFTLAEIIHDQSEPTTLGDLSFEGHFS